MDRDPVINVLFEIRLGCFDCVGRGKIILGSCNAVRGSGLIIQKITLGPWSIIRSYNPLMGDEMNLQGIIVTDQQLRRVTDIGDSRIAR